MRRTMLVPFLVLITAIVPLSMAGAQDVTPDAAGDMPPPSVAVSDQLSLDGTVTVDSVVSAGPGWIVIHADVNNAPGPVIGIAPVQPGPNQAVSVMIDVGGATPQVWAMLHVDDGQAGVFEFGKVAGADAPVQQDGAVVMQPMALTALRAFDQMITNDTVVTASVVSSTGGWLVIHADNNGQPGPVLGQTPVVAGTVPAVYVVLAPEGRTPVLWPMLHVDDGQAGVYEFDGSSGLDNPIVVNGGVATVPFNSTEAMTIQTAAGAPLDTSAGMPYLSAFNQNAMGDGARSTFFVEGVLSPGPGWVDVHADAGGHPGKSLGVTGVAAGESFDINVALDATANPAPPQTLTPVVFPMLHVDDGQAGVYEYLMIPGLDLPIVVNGAILSYPVRIDVVPLPPVTPTAEATPEATPEATDESTPEATDEPEGTPEVTEAPGETTPEVTEAPGDGGEATEPAPEVTEPPGDGGGNGTIDETPEATAAV